MRKKSERMSFLKDLNLFSLSEKEVIINSEEKYKGEEKGSGREEMPHIMIVKEIQNIAELIFIPGIKKC